jgi:hypothetical protein
VRINVLLVLGVNVGVETASSTATAWRLKAY